MTPEPTRQSHASLALISSHAENQHLWLGQWNEAWQAISFVGGHREEDESYRECMIREIREELGLSMTNEFRVPGKPAKIVEYTAFSKRADQWTRYHLELFSVELGFGVAGRLPENRDNHWLGEHEIAAGVTDNDVTVSPTMKKVFDEAGLWTRQPLGEIARKRTR